MIVEYFVLYLSGVILHLYGDHLIPKNTLWRWGSLYLHLLEKITVYTSSPEHYYKGRIKNVQLFIFWQQFVLSKLEIW